MKIKCEITIRGNTISDIIIPLDVIKDLLKDGFTSGHDSNDTGEYSFDLIEG